MQQSLIFDDNLEEQTEDVRRKSTRALLRVVQASDQDHEWYPTTENQIDAIREDILKKQQESRSYYEQGKIRLSVLDVGAGDGRMLMKLTDGERYAIEKSTVLINAMDPSIAIIGTDFHAQTLVDKKVSVVVSNPPYSEFEYWGEKIISEANAALVYLIMPTRWSENQRIKDALALRKAEPTVIGSYDYLEADRVARAKVDIVCIELGSLGYRGESYSDTDPFDIWFDKAFPLNAPETEVTRWAKRQAMEDAIDKRVASSNEIVKREGLAKLLDTLYQQELSSLMQSYQAMTSIPGDLLRELDINITNVKAGLRLKITSLKDVYWKKLFDGLTSITDKLCSKTRSELLKKLTAHTNVDYSLENAVAVVIWALKTANEYYESQIIDVFETMTEVANVIKYKSNEKTFHRDGWRYCRSEYHLLGAYKLDYRIVLERVGGIDNGYSPHKCGLSGRAIELVGDLVTIAQNIGFDAAGNVHATSRRWLPGKKQEYFYFDHTTGKKEILFEAKAFLNGNLHLKLNSKYIQKLNCIHGKLKGWVRSAQEAADEMGIPVSVAEEAFSCGLRLTAKEVPLLIGVID